jgi:hypothetical protein
LYRGPSGDFIQFLKRLDVILKYLHNPKSEFIICGNINYLDENKSNQGKRKNKRER